MPQYPKNKLAQLVIKACEFYEVKTLVISPGSRNAPLTIGFVNHPDMETLSVVDERSAAFFALGIAQQTQKPVAVVCTSGSALLNYYPAIAEAFYSQIPLIVISADRPKHLIDIADGQTIRQENVFDNHILCNANLREETEFIEANKKLLEEAFQTALLQNGPVHINVPFDDPLYELVPELEDFNFTKIPKNTKSLLNEIPLAVEELQQFADIWNASTKKMVLLGENFPDELIQTQLTHFTKDKSVIVLTEVSSNVADAQFINCIDKVIFPMDHQQMEILKPEILLTFGGMVVSKRIKEFLRNHPPKHHWHISKTIAPDTYFCLNHHFKISPQLFFSQFFFLTKTQKSTYQTDWLQLKNHRFNSHQDYLNKCVFSDLKVFEMALESLPAQSMLQLSNSSVIRYAQLFDINPTIQVFCNRGTSGIDGSTSTAIGAAFAVDKQTVFITGDISFFYDQTALWNQYIPKNFRIILINNQGGGIFRFIPGPSTTNVLDYFETPHNLTAEHLCKMYEFEYHKAENESELKQCLADFYSDANQPKLLEIITPRTQNDVILKSYFKSL
ncbi:MAG: 2-succinyl-5-enolpyruvyl-6-hydroxy-3-cyclohexene-1-carboxylic-acid synthase [Flavobacteriaceae bacterium]|nr:2-succinyl-5-enolpyruvyl-6-hydroxy-3-cyclohexene-1-carboxylic-acid synthase [Flavobacteriaceae bacterium]